MEKARGLLFELLSSFLPELYMDKRKVRPLAAKREGKVCVIYQSKLFTFMVELLGTIALRSD